MVAKFGLGDACKHDKFFMQSILKDPGLKSANAAGSEELVNILKTCLSRLQRKQDVLWTRRPIYAIAAQMDRIMAKAPGLKREKYREFLLKRCLASQTAKYLLKKVHLARLARDYPLFFKYELYYFPRFVKFFDILTEIVFLLIK